MNRRVLEERINSDVPLAILYIENRNDDSEMESEVAHCEWHYRISMTELFDDGTDQFCGPLGSLLRNEFEHARLRDDFYNWVRSYCH